MRTRMILATLVALAAAGLAACSSSDSSAEADFNDADVTFVQEMIPHHRQATEMADLAPDRTKNARVLDLARRIEAAQKPEIDEMSAWLTRWKKDDDHSSHSSMEGMDHDMASMPGMMSDADLASLEAASGATFDRLFLTMMIRHHEGAVSMAKDEQSDGRSKDARGLATTIEADQTSEIAEMKKFLAAG